MNINDTVTSEWRAENNMQLWRSLNFLAGTSNMTVPRMCMHMLTLPAVVRLCCIVCEMTAQPSGLYEMLRQLNCLSPVPAMLHPNLTCIALHISVFVSCIMDLLTGLLV